MSQPEAILKAAIRKTLTAMGVLVLKNEIGARGWRKFGLGEGSPDLVVVLRPHGTFLGLEAKIGPRVATEEQKAFGAVLEAHGGRYVVVRSVAEAVAAVTLVRKGGV